MGVEAKTIPAGQAPSPQVAQLRADFADGVFPAGCPSRTVLDHITSKWGVLILAALSEGEQRWSELRRRAEGISEKMLAQTLKTLERDGLVLRKAQPVIPPRVDYSLTERGYELTALLVPLVTWAFDNAEDILGGQR
jgi:DNA-binding HxlR family transcriptional regulator